MKKPVTCNIGISLGTRSVGFAIIVANILQTYRVFVFKGKWSKQKLDKILNTLTKAILPKPCTVAIKVPGPSYCSKPLKDLEDALADFLTKEDILFKVLKIEDLKRHCFGDDKSNKRRLVECIGMKYEQLFLKYEREFKSKHAHYTKLFEATIAAEMSSSSKNAR